MNITVLNDRSLIIDTSDVFGSQNENNATELNFNFPENFNRANKKIVFITKDGIYWDLIENDFYKITNAITKYRKVSAYIWIVDTENDIDFRSKYWNLDFYENQSPNDVVPSEEEINAFDTMIAQLNSAIEKVDNVDIDLSKVENITTITITNKDGIEKTAEIEDGKDYVITHEDYQEIADIVEETIQFDIPTKTSDLTNDSGFIDNTVNNLVNYELKNNTGTNIDLSIDSSTYVMTLLLKNSAGTVLSTKTVDLPLETMVVGASYDSSTREIVLILKNGNTTRFSVADLVSGLQTEINSNNKLASDLVDDTNNTNKFVTSSEKATWNSKYNKPNTGIPKTDLSSDVQTSLSKADTAIQEHQDITGKENISNKVTSISSSSTDTQYPSAKCVYDLIGNIESLLSEV